MTDWTEASRTYLRALDDLRRECLNERSRVLAGEEPGEHFRPLVVRALLLHTVRADPICDRCLAPRNALLHILGCFDPDEP